jgi:hypothetical protein
MLSDVRLLMLDCLMLDSSWYCDQHLVGWARLLRTFENPRRVPDFILTPIDTAHFLQQLRQRISNLRPIPVTHNARPGTFVHKDLLTCTHIFLRQDSIRKALDPPYTGPYPVLSRHEKTLRILVRGKPHTVSTNRVKSAYIFSEADDPPTTSNPAVHPQITTSNSASPPTPLRTTRSGRHVHFPDRYLHWDTFLVEEGDVMWELPTCATTDLCRYPGNG